MKTPREMLLKHHRAAEPALDAIRQRVVTKLMPNVPSSPGSILKLLWTELILPCRRVWLSLAVVWMVILVLNNDRIGPAFAERSHSDAHARSPQVMAILDEELKLRNELLLLSGLRPIVLRRDHGTRPRSAVRVPFVTV